MRDAYLKWLIFEKRTDSDTLWVGFQAGWRFREQATKRPAPVDQRGGSPEGQPSIMDILNNGTMENK